MKLSVENISFGYAWPPVGKLIGKNVSLTLSTGEVLVLLGPNGAGKTTLFKTILGLLRPESGRIALDGKAIEFWPKHERAKRMAYVPQAHTALFPFCVREVVLMGRASRVPAFSSPGADDIAIADKAMSSLGILHLADRIYTEISGGERQIALIARALAQEPEILVMDEPTASLDYGNQMRVLAHVRELATRGIAVILSTHNPEHAFLCADRVALFHDNRIIAQGKPDKVLTAEMLKRLYNVDVVIGTLPGTPNRVCAPLLSGNTTSNEETENGPPK